MPRITVILLLLLSCTLKAQVVFKTIVEKTIVAGKPFNVEYTLENVGEDDVFTSPVFSDLRRISGPTIYPGRVIDPNSAKTIFIKNYVFTLMASRPGRYVIPGASAIVNGRFIKSDNVVIQVVERASTPENQSEYFLRPDEDPYEKMRKNLFMKVMVNKRSCYIGEPVVATFKLYSRLQSKSDIVKNPGFYGFSVQDIINLDNRVTVTETINGKKFDVHTVRSVQLYPLQAGIFTIDPMEVLNKVEFSKSAVNKKAEQEIVEGVFDDNNDAPGNTNIVTYENNISTEKIVITVKPYPEKNKPDTFSGATGRFSIQALAEKNKLGKNEEGDLLIIVEGKGNFTQISSPSIQWPAGLEGFESSIKDSLDKKQVPLKGKRVFRFPFVAAKPGSYIIPAVSLSFFDVDSNRYKTVTTQPVEVSVSHLEKEKVVHSDVNNTAGQQGKNWPLAAGAGIMVIILVLGWLLYKRNRKTATPVEESKSIPSLDEIFEPVYPSLKVNDGRFYIVLQKAIWDYLGLHLQLEGSKMNKYELRRALEQKGIPSEQAQTILSILQECEAAAFTKAEFLHDKQELLIRAKRALEGQF